MPESTITFRVDAALKRRFATRAQELDRDGSQVLRDFMRSFVGEEQTYEDWFRSRVGSPERYPPPGFEQDG